MYYFPRTFNYYCKFIECTVLFGLEYCTTCINSEIKRIFLKPLNCSFIGPSILLLLQSTALYLGDINGLVILEQLYSEQYEHLGRTWYTSITFIRECILLSLYWAGRLCNKKENELLPGTWMHYKMKFILHFQVAMRILWHKRPCFELDILSRVIFTYHS